MRGSADTLFGFVENHDLSSVVGQQNHVDGP